MGFWSKLFRKKKSEKLDLASVQPRLNVFAVDTDGDGKVQDGTIWERPAELSVDIEKTIEKVEELIKEVKPDATISLPDELEKKRKRQEAAKKAAATRASKKVEQVKADAERMAEATKKAQASVKKPATKKTQPKKK